MSSKNNNGDDEKRYSTATKALVANDRVEGEMQEEGFVEEEEEDNASASLTKNDFESQPTGTSGDGFDVREMEMIEKEEEPPEEDESDNRRDSHQISNEEENGEDTELITARRTTRPGAERVYPSGHEGDSSNQLDILDDSPTTNIESRSQTNDIEIPDAFLVPEEPMVPEEPILQIDNAVPMWFEMQKIRRMVMGILVVVVVVVGIILLSVLLTRSDDEPPKPETAPPTSTEKPSSQETSAPTLAEDFRRSEAFEALNNEYALSVVPVLPNMVNDLIGAKEQTNSTSQEKAAEWLIFNDPLALNHTESWFFPRYGLAVLYFATTKPESTIAWTNSSWLSGFRSCNWMGITCDNDKDTIAKLDLGQQHLEGTLPVEVKYLATLKEFIIQNNELVGTPPWKSFIGLQNLTSLDLRHNLFTGTLSKGIGTMSSLKYLYLSKNRFSGTIPNEIIHATYLETLELHSNDLNGTYPDSSCMIVQDFTIDCNDVSCLCCEQKNCYPERYVSIGSLWGGTSDDWFGASVSLSDKGDVMAVGSPQHVEGVLPDVGLIQVFGRQEANHRWEEIFNTTGEEKDEEVGSDSLSLSGDGKQMIFGSTLASNSTGYIKIVEVESGKTMKLVGGNEYDYFGSRVSISSNGHRVAVAASGYIRVFDKMDDGSLTQIGDDISADVPGVALSGVALSADGDVLGIGELSYNNLKGRVRVMEWNGGRWIQIGKEILGENDEDYFGWTLDLSADGQRVLISTYLGNYIKVYEYDGFGWEMLGKLEGGSDDGNSFGSSISISNNGNRIIVGCPFFTSDGIEKRGRALVYQYYNKSWDQIGQNILGKEAYVLAGWSVSISSDGHHFAVGIPNAFSEDQGYVGSVIVYRIE